MRQLHLGRAKVKSLLSVDAHMQRPEAPEQEEDDRTMEKAWDDESGKELIDPKRG